MENKDIHNGLDKKEIRDFLSKMRSKEGDTCSYLNLEVISVLEKQILNIQKQIVHIKNFYAVETLIKYSGWENFDVSEEIDHYNPDTYFEFIGTKEEFKEFENKSKR